MVEIRYIGHHSPFGMVIDVDEGKALTLTKNGDWEYVTTDKYDIKEPIIKHKKRIVPDKSWKEKTIKKWITDEGLDVRYDIINDSKQDILLRLKDKGHI